MKIAIASGKGGTGKTTLAANLASYAAQVSKVLLVDLDVEEPNSGIFVNGELLNEQMIFTMVPEWHEQECILCGKCSDLCRFNAITKLGEKIIVLQQLCHSCYACSELCPAGALVMESKPLGFLQHSGKENLTFITTQSIVGTEQTVPLISQTIDYLSSVRSETLLEIWDSPPGTSCPMIAVVNNADFVVLITEPTPFGLYDLTLAVETMLQLDKPFSVVVNRYGIGNDKVFTYCDSNNIPIWAVLPDQRSIAELYSNGELIYPKVPEFRQGLEIILNKLWDLKEQECGR